MSCCWSGGHTWRSHALSELRCFVAQINYVWPPMAKCAVRLLWTQPSPSVESGPESSQLSGEKPGPRSPLGSLRVSSLQDHLEFALILMVCFAVTKLPLPWRDHAPHEGHLQGKVKWWKRLDIRRSTCLVSASFLELLLLLSSYCCCCFFFFFFFNFKIEHRV